MKVFLLKPLTFLTVLVQFEALTSQLCGFLNSLMAGAGIIALIAATVSLVVIGLRMAGSGATGQGSGNITSNLLPVLGGIFLVASAVTIASAMGSVFGLGGC